MNNSIFGHVNMFVAIFSLVVFFIVSEWYQWIVFAVAILNVFAGAWNYYEEYKYQSRKPNQRR